MKKVVVAIVGAFVLIAVMLVVFMICIINRGTVVNHDLVNNLKLINTQKVLMQNTDDLNIRVYTDEVEFLPSDSNELIIKEYKAFTPDKDELITVTSQDNRIFVRAKKPIMNFFINRNRKGKVEIYLPSTYSNSLTVTTSSGTIKSELALQLKDFSASSASGSIRFNKVKASDIDVSTSSGDINIQKAEGNRSISSASGTIKIFGGSGDSDISTASGSIYIEKSIGRLQVQSSSGDIRIDGSNGKKELNTSSGTIHVEDTIGEISAFSTSGALKISASEGGGDFETSSGAISIDVKKLTSSISMSASSGDIKLTIPTDSIFKFSADTSSGRIKTDFDEVLTMDEHKKHANGMVGENPNLQIKTQTSSGNISVFTTN